MRRPIFCCQQMAVDWYDKTFIQKVVIIMYKYATHTMLLILILWLSACSNDQPLTKKQRLLQSIQKIEQGFEARILSDILEYISENYQDDKIGDFENIKRAIHVQLLRNKSVHVFSIVKDIQWTDDHHAKVEIVAAMGAKPIDSVNILSSIKADMAKFEVDFVLEGEVYKVQSALWSWAEPSDFL